MSAIVGSKAGAWLNQALDHASNTDALYVATAYMKPRPENIYDVRSRWVVYMMPSRQDLDDWYRATASSLERYHYIAAFDKTASDWKYGRPVSSIAESGAYTSGDLKVGTRLAPEAYRPAAPHAYVGDIFGDIGHAVSSAVSDVAKVIQHPPAWLAVVMPLFTPGTQKWWAGKVGGKTGEQLYDAGTNAVVTHALGPTGPKLLSAFNSVMDDAANGHLNAQEMIAKAPQVAHLATAAKQSPQALQQAIIDTGSHVKGSWAKGRGEYGPPAVVGAALSSEQRLHRLDRLIALHETYWAELAQQNPSPQVRDFFFHHWDPFFSQWWWAYRPYLDRYTSEQVAHFVHQSAEQLSRLREYAANSGIHTPDLGTTRHGFIPSEGLKVSGRPRLPYNAARRRKRP